METQGAQQKTVRSRANRIRKHRIKIFKLDQLQDDQGSVTTEDVSDDKASSSLQAKHRDEVCINVLPLHDTTNSRQSRRLGRLRLNMIAHSIVENTYFRWLALFITILNAIVLGVETELPYYTAPEKEKYMLACTILNWCILSFFIGEFILKWVDDFHLFWKSSWNIFDFVVTMVSLLPQLIMAVRPDTAKLQVMELLKQFRTLRCLKIISRCTRARLIMIPLSRSFKAIGNLLALLMILSTIYAVVGVELFKNFSRSEVEDLALKDSFKDFISALISLFILFTMDSWTAMLDNIQKVQELNQFLCGLYIILWLILASCIFRSMIVGMMVNKFQEFRGDQDKELQQIEWQARKDLFNAQNLHRTPSHLLLTGAGEMSGESEESDEPQQSTVTFTTEEWETYVMEAIAAMKQKKPVKVEWPTDKLFRYYELLEELERNREQMMRLQNDLNQCLRKLHN